MGHLQTCEDFLHMLPAAQRGQVLLCSSLAGEEQGNVEACGATQSGIVG